MIDKVDTRRITNSMRQCFAKFPQAVGVLARLEQLYEHECNVEEPEHLMLLGDPGTGKTTLLQYFDRKHPRLEHSTFTEVPVLYVEVPSRTSIKGLAGLMLQAMGSEYWDRGDEVARTFQLVTLLRACRTRVVILDEVNHLVDRGGEKTHYEVGDWIKQLGARSKRSIVLAGTSRAERLLRTNEQLASRFGEMMTLRAFSTVGGRLAEFSSVLATFASLFADIPCIDLTKPANAEKVAFATHGRLRSICRLLVRTVEVASRSPKPIIDLKAFSIAFEEVIYPRASEERNPFSIKFNGMPLVKPGEPFATEERTNAIRK